MYKNNEIIYEVLEVDEKNKIDLINTIKYLNNDYPVALDKKVDIIEYVDKIMNNGFIVAAKINEKVIGFTTFYANNYNENEGAFSLLGVLKQYRKLGIARQLFEEALEVMRKCGMETAHSFTHKSNIKAIEFHLSMGFTIDKDRVQNQTYNISLIRNL